MTNQEILANGPEGWTHVEVFESAPVPPKYWRRDNKSYLGGKFIYDKWSQRHNGWFQAVSPTGNMRSRSDIERIVYLESVLKGEMA